MERRTRVHELAKDLGMSVKDLLALLNKEGVLVKSGGSTLEKSIARRVRDAHEFRTAATVTAATLAIELGVAEQSVMDVVQRETGEPTLAGAVLPDPLAHQVRQRIRAADQSNEIAREQRVATEPEHVLLAEDGAMVIHHRDYISGRREQALCGYRFGVGPALADPDSLQAVCGDCEGRLPTYHLTWWRARCVVLESELAKSAALNGHLQKECKRYKKHVSTLTDQVQRSRPAKTQKPKSSRASSRKRAVGLRYAEKRNSLPREKRIADPEKVQQRIREMNAPRPPKTQAEKWSDEAAADTMRSHKPSSWRVGGSPSSYGNGF